MPRRGQLDRAQAGLGEGLGGADTRAPQFALDHQALTEDDGGDGPLLRFHHPGRHDVPEIGRREPQPGNALPGDREAMRGPHLGRRRRPIEPLGRRDSTEVRKHRGRRRHVPADHRYLAPRQKRGEAIEPGPREHGTERRFDEGAEAILARRAVEARPAQVGTMVGATRRPTPSSPGWISRRRSWCWARPGRCAMLTTVVSGRRWRSRR